MKICMAATTFPRFAGDGQGAFVWGLARALQRAGARVRVIAMHTPGAAGHEVVEDVEIIRPRYWWPEEAESLRKDGGGLPITLRKYPLARLQLPFFGAVHSAAIARHARDCDLIHAHWTLSGGAALLGRALHGKPVLVTVQGSDIFTVPRHPVGRWVTRLILRRCAGVTALTQALAQAVAAIGIPGERVRIIPNGVDIDDFVPPAHDARSDDASAVPTVLFTGSLIPRKAPQDLVAALALLPPQLAHTLLVLVGDGPDEAALREQVRTLGLGDRVTFTGFLPQAEVRAWMRRAHLFALPSREEGQGVVLLEALASGTPVVASDVDGIREVVTPEVGLRVPPANPAALAAALAEVLGDANRRRAMSVTARQRAVEHYDWANIAQRYLAVYAEILSANGSGRGGSHA